MLDIATMHLKLQKDNILSVNELDAIDCLNIEHIILAKLMINIGDKND